MGSSRRKALPPTPSRAAKSNRASAKAAALVPRPNRAASNAAPKTNARRSAIATIETQRGDLATYVYCVVRSAARPPLPQRGARLPAMAGPARVVPMSAGRWLVVADVPLGEYGQDPLVGHLKDLAWVSRCGVAHQTGVETYLGSKAVVPMTLFTIFSSDQRALQELRRDDARLDDSLARVAGRTEWVVRVLRGDAPPRAQAGARTTATAAGISGATRAMAARTGTAEAAPATTVATATTATAADDPPSRASGREFLQAKADARAAVRRAAAETDAAVRGLADELASLSDEVRYRPATQAVGLVEPILDAAFLVAKASETKFGRAARKLAEPLTARGFRVSITGPWPCYSFVAARSSDA